VGFWFDCYFWAPNKFLINIQANTSKPTRKPKEKASAKKARKTAKLMG
jgi:hypothetical protein